MVVKAVALAPLSARPDQAVKVVTPRKAPVTADPAAQAAMVEAIQARCPS